ncbi:hypothetical protein PB2503_07072 [Parvularcula bermudensis HTCC2503]|uniref:Uncharacterized protein n=1 Tax=Parvularcula bermudensis (strain ATCC BAA-594 / HTCC2503 / KCTC 12087) TaxID=314260 RepID=E0TEA5_PARBH|nr:hypothetical protein [Parvularcula bermudensis]ADM09480.1 hypothetical protein PB2503_07072 [Parvularcula bermudensis HTCC2503]
MKYMLTSGLAAVAAFSTPAQASGLIDIDQAIMIYRVYLPEGAVDDVQLPTLTVHYENGRKANTIKPCKDVDKVLKNVGCAWQIVVNPELTDSRANIALPDLSSIYWATRIPTGSIDRITVSGEYPAARYMSFGIYDQTFTPFTVHGETSFLADFQIAPDEGSENPWQTGGEAGGSFTITINHAEKGLGQNTLPMPPDNLEGGLEFPLMPRPCEDDCPPLKAFSRPSNTAGFFPNLDNAYLLALYDPQPDEVLVMTGQAPARGNEETKREPQIWPPETPAVRYWSLCNTIYRLPYPAVLKPKNMKTKAEACIADYKIPQDEDGQYRIVIGALDQMPEDFDFSEAAWVMSSPTEPKTRHALLFRNMLPSDWDYSIQDVPSDDNPQSAKDIMGPYYPTLTPCAVSTLAAEGVEGCLK